LEIFSPLLFALIIEPLEIAIRSKQAIQGIRRAGAVYKIFIICQWGVALHLWSVCFFTQSFENY